MLPTWFKEYLSYHKAERRAIIFLVLVLLGLIGFNIYQRFFWQDDWQEMYLKYGEQIFEFEEESTHKSTGGESAQPWLPEKKPLFVFDPNTLDSTGWVALGFSPKQTAAIIKYRSAGFVFRKPEDVKKLFVVDEEKYDELEPFINIKEFPDEPQPRKEFIDFEPKKEKKFELIIVELNSADTAQLQQLHGIGSSFAKRMVKYRELLGGYISREQVLEVYGMDSARYLPIEESLLVDTTYRVRININTADYKTLLRHPYLNKNQVSAIINYRKQHGSFNSLSELNKIHLISKVDIEKMHPYFSTEVD